MAKISKELFMQLINRNLLGGIAGAIALNLVHQLAKKVDKDAPQVDKIGEEALSKTIKSAGFTPPKGQKLFLSTLAGDLVSNSIYYSLIGKGKKGSTLLRGIVFGAVAGIGALTAPKPLGLNDQPVNKTPKTKLLTVAWYVLGGVVTAFTVKLANGIADRIHEKKVKANEKETYGYDQIEI